ncbi:hypothetical protein [Alicyclobacillus fodiniaquatilis]|uniref:Uncharacterized protein n=1 Tax=Alicyclobacillus fodiniaquatilis TaxID=1661150 RepID=A0ABW4JJB8_9BACL
MSLVQVITRLLRNGEETSEKHRNPKFRTRYYRERREKMMENAQQIIKSKLSSWKITYVDSTRGEIIVEKRQLVGKSDIVISIYEISPIRSAIDVSSSLRSLPGDLGTSHTNIMDFFYVLDREVKPEKS